MRLEKTSVPTRFAKVIFLRPNNSLLPLERYCSIQPIKIAVINGKMHTIVNPKLSTNKTKAFSFS